MWIGKLCHINRSGPVFWRHTVATLLPVSLLYVLCMSVNTTFARRCCPISHKSGRCAVELYRAPHLWYPPFYTSPMAAVLSNIEPPALRRKAATDKLVEKIVKHDSWPIQPDILSPPLLWLTSRKPLCLVLQPVDIKSRWRHNWKSAQVVNSHLCDTTIRQPGFDLPRQQWSLLNHFRTEQGHCVNCRRKWRLTDTDLCPCGENQTMSHIVESCPLTKLNGGLSRLHSADEDAVSWLASYGLWHAYEKKKKNWN